MKHKTSAVSDLWGFYLFLLGLYGTSFFEKLQDFISACDPGLFCFVSACITYAVITAIKNKTK